jgi:hypothetical protein
MDIFGVELGISYYTRKAHCVGLLSHGPSSSPLAAFEIFGESVGRIVSAVVLSTSKGRKSCRGSQRRHSNQMEIEDFVSSQDAFMTEMAQVEKEFAHLDSAEALEV